VVISGCPPIADVMTGTIVHLVTFDRLPELDDLTAAQGVLRPANPRQLLPPGLLRFQPVCERFDDEGARKGWCLYKLGCRGPVTETLARWSSGTTA